MSLNKWLVKTSVVASMLMLSACGESSENDTSPEEIEQEEMEQNEDTQLNQKTDDLQEESDSKNSDEKENQNEHNGETDDPDSDNSKDPTNGDSEQTDTGNNDGPQLDLEEDILDPSSLSVLVNKQYSLPEDYTPENLVTVEVPTVLPNPEIKQMRAVAAEALKEMFDAAEESGIILHARSGYRSYQTQIQLFQNYASNHGEEAANKYSARAGESEHQTGLVMDITSQSVNLQITSDFGETKEGRWVSEHAHDYGFIIRYPEGKSEITGYVYEPWHLRYLGQELAADVYESGLTYEEYLVDRGVDIEIQ